MQNLDWYHTLNKPLLSPPDWVFAPVWTVLYLMIFVSFVLFVRSESTQSKVLPATIFFLQLILNLSWSPIFFGLENPKAALFLIGLLLVSIAAVIFSFYKYSKTASLLLIPYFLWVIFAAYLNFELFRLN